MAGIRRICRKKRSGNIFWDVKLYGGEKVWTRQNILMKFIINSGKTKPRNMVMLHTKKILSGWYPSHCLKGIWSTGVGTGWPIGTALKEKGITVDGCDLAESSVALARKELENESGIWTGDVLSYEGQAQYDVVYCVRASWYIPDFYATVSKMITMTKQDRSHSVWRHG